MALSELGSSLIYVTKKITAGVNDLATTHPDLAAQWHPSLNSGLLISQVSAGSDRKVWWICAQNHSWAARVYSRKNGAGCPYCAGLQVLTGETDMATTHPELAARWHPERNGRLLPSQVFAKSGKKYWWLCQQGHTYQDSSSHQASGRGCSVCSGYMVIPGVNDLQTTHPQIAQEWNYQKNENLKPTQVIMGTHKNLWWVCKEGHEWQSTGTNRKAGNNCPICAGQMVMPGVNDMATTHPELARQFDARKNGGITPTQVIAGTNKKIWWICDLGHSWKVSGNNRVSINSGCPVCSGRLILPGFNDLATTHKDLVSEWHPTLNGNLLPSQVSTGTHKKVWWLCKEGHSTKVMIYSRAIGGGCPVCGNKQVLIGFNDLETTHPDLVLEWHPTKNESIAPNSLTYGSDKKVWWQCIEGHEWKAAVSSRTQGRGCSSCAKYGYKIEMPAMLYFIENTALRARKIGITNIGTTRVEGFAKQGWIILHTVESKEGSLIRKLESSLFEWIRRDLKLPSFLGSEEMGRQGGWSETFTTEGPSNEAIIQRIIERQQDLGIANYPA